MKDIVKGQLLVIVLVVFGFLLGMSAINFIENQWAHAFFSIGWTYFCGLLIKTGFHMCKVIEEKEGDK